MDKFYDPAIGRFLEPEPLLQDPIYVQEMASEGHSVPVYGYALNNPIHFTDKNGLAAGVDDAAEATVVVGIGEILFYTGVIEGGVYCIGTHCLGTWDDLTGNRADENSCQISKGGKQKGENEYTRAAKMLPKWMDPCEWLADQYRKAPNADERMKIKFAQKVMGCRWSSGGGP